LGLAVVCAMVTMVAAGGRGDKKTMSNQIAANISATEIRLTSFNIMFPRTNAASQAARHAEGELLHKLSNVKHPESRIRPGTDSRVDHLPVGEIS